MGHYIAAVRRCIPAMIAAFLAAFGMAGAAPPAALDPGGTAVVAAVADGDTLRLTDGRTLRLAGIIGPAANEPLADAARARLSALAQGRVVVIAYGARHMDRHGRFVVQAWLAEDDGARGTWLQEALLTDG